MEGYEAGAAGHALPPSSAPGSATAAGAAAEAAGSEQWGGSHWGASHLPGASGSAEAGGSSNAAAYGDASLVLGEVEGAAGGAGAGAGGWDAEGGAGDGSWAVEGGGSAGGGWAGEEGSGALGAAPGTDAAAGASYSYSPAEYLAYMEGEVRRLSASKSQLEQQMAAAATSAYQQVSATLGEAGTGVPVPADVASLVDELAVLAVVRQYLQYLQELEALARHAEKAAASLQRLHGEGGSGTGFIQAASEAVEAYSHAMGYVVVVRQLSTEDQVPSAKLRSHAERLIGRVDAAQASLRSLLSKGIQQRLTACSWPPPLTLSAGSGGPAGPAAAPGAAKSPFEGPRAAASVDELQRLLLVLLTLQRAAQHEEFQALAESGGEPPLLWVAEELAQGVDARLRHHFAEGLPTDRADKPEWLFGATIKAVQQSAPSVALFQPCIDAHNLESWYNMQLEFARAVAAVGLGGILKEHLLPQLAAAGGEEWPEGDAQAAAALWLHYADEAIQFERRFAPLRGHFEALADDDDAATAAHPGSAIELLFEEPEWRDGWLGAEGWDAQRQLEAACDMLNAWQPAHLVLGLPVDGDDFMADTPRARDVVASRQEFWPPACAEQVLALLSSLVRRCGWVAGAANRRSFMQAVPLCVLRSFRERLGRQLAVAEGYRGMLEEQWLPSVGAAICAAHYLEHQLREPQGVLLLVELQEAAAQEAGGTGGQQQQQQQQGGGRDRSGAGGVASLVEREASAFGTLRRQWAYKLAKQAVDRFHELFAPYKHDLSVFTVGYDSENPSAAYQNPGGEEEGPASVSTLMLIAADKLHHMLNALAQHLDSVVFRDVWKAVALAVNYALFNEIATEALFSVQGTRQFDADVGALAAVFGAYTSRPAAHFKETKEACKLLLLPTDQAAAVLSALQRQPGAAKSVLKPMGVKLLNADQAATVLMQRLDLITAGQ